MAALGLLMVATPSAFGDVPLNFFDALSGDITLDDGGGGSDDGGGGSGDGMKLEVDLVNGGHVRLITDEETLGISVTSESGSIVPTVSGAPYMFILPGANEHLIQHGTLGMPVAPGVYDLNWSFNPSRARDLKFVYGLPNAEQVDGAVEYLVIPEPGSIVLLLCGLVGLGWYTSRRRRGE